MDKRTLLAFALMAVVLVVTPMFFKSPSRPVPGTDTTAEADTTPPADTSARAPGATPAAPVDTARPVLPAVTTKLTTARAEYDLVSPGAVPMMVRIPGYRDLSPTPRRNGDVVLQSEKVPLLRFRLARGADTVALDTVAFSVEQNGSAVAFTSPVVALTYQPSADGTRIEVRGTVPNALPGSALLIDLPTTLESVEADTLDDMRHLAYGYKRPRRDVESISFSKLDNLETRVDTGTMQWVAARNKYWLVAVMKRLDVDTAPAFRGLIARGGVLKGKVHKTARATTVHPIQNGQIAFDLYAGPQSWPTLHAFGNDLENANPYAGFLHSVVQPFATIVMRTLLWMKSTFRVNYGWVLVLFGVAIRLAMWPLNQKAMRTSIQMQRLSPQITEIQKKYRNDPEKLREAMMRVYTEHGMSPISPMLGCLPMLLPMPVFFALYFVFQNTIEFRDVPFLWVPDLALKDPYYIMPIIMGLSMLLLSWVGLRGMPPNPQAKFMSYTMPAMFLFFFLNIASGLNLYYAVQNLAGLPQQWILTRERQKAGVGAPTPPSRRT